MEQYKNYLKYQTDLLPLMISYTTSKLKKASVNNIDEKLTEGFLEISATIDSLLLATQFVKIAPPRSRKITKINYLEYHMQHYLQEVYILKERLIKYAKQIMRYYSKHLGKDKVESDIKPLLTLINNTLKKIIEVRGEHVHDARYTDTTLNHAKIYNLAAKNDSSFSQIEKNSYAIAKLYWTKQLKEFNNEILNLVDFYFGKLHLIVFSSSQSSRDCEKTFLAKP